MKWLEKIINCAPNYKIKAEYINENVIRLYTVDYLCDSWLVEFSEDGLELKHINKSNKFHKPISVFCDFANTVERNSLVVCCSNKRVIKY